MKITITTLGTRGDIQPYIALAIGLQEAGHEVRIATHQMFREFITGHSIGFHPVPPDDLTTMMESKLGQNTATGNPLSSMIGGHKFFKSFEPMIPDILDALEEAAKGSDLIINSLVCAGQLTAEKLNMPCIMGCLWPIGKTKDYRHPVITIDTGPFNKITHGFVEVMMGMLFLHIFKYRIKNKMSIKNMLSGVFGYIKKNNYPWLYGFSESFLKRPDDWPEFRHITGYWFLDDDTEWKPSDKLLKFLDNGPKPVYIGLGSVVCCDKNKIIGILLKAMNKLGQRVIISSFSGIDIDSKYNSENMFISGYTPHSWLFPKMAGVLHHGGAGTTSAGIRAGVPTLIIPFMVDQFFWGEQIFKQKLGPKYVKRKELNVDRLVDRIHDLTENKEYKKNCMRLRDKISEENGIKSAIKIIEGAIKNEKKM